MIGLSAFGMALVQALAQERCRILAVDIDEHKVNQVRELADEAVIADARERSALEALRVADYDAVVLSVGEPLDSSLLAVLHLRDLKVEHIYAKAVTEDHRRLLLKLGVDEAIFPEADMARRVALTLSDPMVLDHGPAPAKTSPWWKSRRLRITSGGPWARSRPNSPTASPLSRYVICCATKRALIRVRTPAYPTPMC